MYVCICIMYIRTYVYTNLYTYICKIFMVTSLSSVQSLALPILLDPKFRKDMMMKSKTGSGKYVLHSLATIHMCYICMWYE